MFVNNACRNDLTNQPQGVQQTQSKFKLVNVNEDFVRNEIKLMNVNKATGIDGFCIRLLKAGLNCSIFNF